jgi:G3E family GTPase
MADPGPVAQTFFMDEEMKEKLRLDAIVTMVDAKHVVRHLNESQECDAQIAFADIVLLNKGDLVTQAELARLGAEIRRRNRLARIFTTVHGDIDLTRILGVRTFDLEAKAEAIPEFLVEELPFEWVGRYALAAGEHTLTLEQGPDPTLDLVLAGPGVDRPEAFEGWKREGIALFSREPAPGSPAPLLPGRHLYRLPVADGGRFTLRIPEGGRYALFTQHLPEEFDLSLMRGEVRVSPSGEHRYASPHEHDATVASVGLSLAGDLDPKRFEAWIVALLRRKGVDIFRMKGILSLKGDPRRFVFQGVHMLFDGQPGRAWESGAQRANQLVFIGRALDRAELEAGLSACRA